MKTVLGLILLLALSACTREVIEHGQRTFYLSMDLDGVPREFPDPNNSDPVYFTSSWTSAVTSYPDSFRVQFGSACRNGFSFENETFDFQFVDLVDSTKVTEQLTLKDYDDFLDILRTGPKNFTSDLCMVGGVGIEYRVGPNTFSTMDKHCGSNLFGNPNYSDFNFVITKVEPFDHPDHEDAVRIEAEFSATLYGGSFNDSIRIENGFIRTFYAMD